MPDNPVSAVPLATPNVVVLRDSLNQLVLALDPEHDRPTQPLDERIPLPEPTLDNLLDFLSGVRTALIQVGAAKDVGD